VFSRLVTPPENQFFWYRRKTEEGILFTRNSSGDEIANFFDDIVHALQRYSRW